MPFIQPVETGFLADISEHVVIVIGIDGKILYHNRKAGCLFAGIAPNQNLFALIVDDAKTILQHNIGIAFYQQTPFDFYWHYKSRFYLISAHPHNQGLWLIIKDITEEHYQSYQYNLCQYRHKIVEDLCRLGFWQLNIKQRRFYWSDGMYRLLKIKSDNTSYYSNIWRKYMFADDIAYYKQQIKELLKHQKDEFSGCLRIITADGDLKDCYIAARHAYFRGMEVIDGVLEENTHCCRSVAENMSLAQISHDIKHHLQAIIALKNTSHFAISSPDEQDYHISKITDLLNDIIQVSKKQYQDAKPNLQKVNLFDFLSDLCREYQALSISENKKIICRLHNANIHTDTAILGRIVGNLLSNALKFASTKVILGNDDKHIWVIDNGIGISSDEQQHIFDAYCSLIRKPESCGLGLAIVKDLCQTLGCRISYKSRLHQYTIFKLHL